MKGVIQAAEVLAVSAMDKGGGCIVFPKESLPNEPVCRGTVIVPLCVVLTLVSAFLEN